MPNKSLNSEVIQMFWKLFGFKPQARSEPDLDPKTSALINAIRERSRDDPLIGAKVGSREIYQRLLDGMKTDRGVHIESLLCALGALAGYSCQASIRAQAVAKGMLETSAFHMVTVKDGRHFYFGDPLNNALAGVKYSIWNLAGGAAQNAGAKSLPDINDIFQYTVQVLGEDAYGIPRVPDKHRPADKPFNYLRLFWPRLFTTVKLFCPNPVEWPILYGLAIQEAINAGKNMIDPALALTIVMESAVPMSKVDLAGN
jgi:hypothetical protein